MKRTYPAMTIDANFIGVWNTLFKDGRSIFTVLRMSEGGVEVVSRKRIPDDNIADEWMRVVVDGTPAEVITSLRFQAQNSDAKTSEYIYDGNFESFKRWITNNHDLQGIFTN